MQIPSSIRIAVCKHVHTYDILRSPKISGVLALIFKKCLLINGSIFYSEEKHLYSSLFKKRNVSKHFQSSKKENLKKWSSEVV